MNFGIYILATRGEFLHDGEYGGAALRNTEGLAAMFCHRRDYWSKVADYGGTPIP
jgi:hypothetical protein